MFLDNSSSPLKLVCDIGSATVALALVDTSKTTPEILFTTKVPMVVQEIFDQDKLEQALIAFFDQAVKKVTDALHSELAHIPFKHIGSASLVFSSPWYATKISTIVMQKDEPFLLDQRGVEEIVEQEEKKFEQEALHGAYSNLGKRDMHVIERELIRVKLNGYETASPYLKKVSNAELSVAMSLVPHNLLLSLVTILKDTLHITRTKSFTFPLVSFGAMQTLFPHETDFLLVDVTGETTDISYIEDNIIVGSHSFTLARNSLIRTVSEKLQLPSDMTLSHLSLYAKGTLEASEKDKMATILDGYFMRFNEIFSKAPIVLRAKEKGVVRVFLTVNDDVADIFMVQFGKPELKRFSPFLISDTALDPFVVYSKHIPHDPFLSVETIFLQSRRSS